MKSKFITKEEIAKTLLVHPRTVDRWLNRKILRGYKLGDGKTALWRISQEDFDKFLKKYKN
jgi:excisionase family DNA binding protein